MGVNISVVSSLPSILWSGEVLNPFPEKLAALSGSSEALLALKLGQTMPSLRLLNHERDYDARQGGPLDFLMSSHPEDSS